jgi:type VI secretion system secreted protein VgrG
VARSGGFIVTTVGYLQKLYPVRITTPFGDSSLLVDQLEGEESISGLYLYRLRMVSESSSLAFETIVAKEASLSIAMPEDDKRFVHGIVSRFRQAGSTVRLTTYHAELRPRLWLLTKTRDSRIFQNKTVPDIIKQILSEYGVTDIKDALTGTYKARDYCVQYQESAFDFISRLMESEGIAYWFTHTDSAHTLVLADDGSAYDAGPTLSTSAGGVAGALTDVLPECDIEVQVTSGKYRSDDYNFETPATDLLGVATGKTATDLDVYDYPAGQDSKDGVEAVVDRRLQALELEGRVIHGASNNAALAPGASFTLQDHPRADFNADYVVSKVWHRADQNSYSNSFEGFPKEVRFRPSLVTPSPRIFGCQTALVVGKSGEEITTDKYGRIKVKFHWDQAPAADETASCWVRVSQGWAGKQWGMFFLPRIGQEVVVSFLDGDPDRPLVTGCVYNAQQTVPYALPDNRTQSGIKTDSSKGGGGFNEIRLEDKKGEESFAVQAQKDMTITVLNDQTATIKNKRSVTVTGDETHANDANLTYTIKKDLSLDVSGKVTLNVTGDLTLKVTGAMQIEGSKDISTKAGMNLKQEAGTNLSQQAGANLSAQAGAQLNVKGALANVESDGPMVIKGAIVKIN